MNTTEDKAALEANLQKVEQGLVDAYKRYNTAWMEIDRARDRIKALQKEKEGIEKQICDQECERHIEAGEWYRIGHGTVIYVTKVAKARKYTHVTGYRIEWQSYAKTFSTLYVRCPYHVLALKRGVPTPANKLNFLLKWPLALEELLDRAKQLWVGQEPIVCYAKLPDRWSEKYKEFKS